MDAPQDQEPRPEPEGPDRIDELATIFIAQQIQQGESDRDYWNAIAEKVDSFLRRSYPERMLPAGYSLDDLRQDVFVRLVADLPRMEIIDRERFWGFVKTLADRATIDFVRNAKAQKRGGGRQPIQQGPGDEGPDLIGQAFDDRVSTASGYARAAEIEEHELDCVRKLPREESREVYLLRRRDRRSFQEIADAIGRNKAVTTRTIYARAQRLVTDCLKARLTGYASGLHREE